MAALSTALERIVRNSDAPNAAFFFEPEFVLDWAARGLLFCSSGSAENPLVAPLCRFFRMASRKWPTPLALVQRALDTFLIPAVGCIHFDDAFWLAWCLSSFTDGDPAVSGARLFCTAEFRDRFFIALYQQDSQNVSAYEMAEPIAEELTKITAAVPRAQRQEVFATEEFRDAVLVRLVQFASSDATIALVRAAFLNIAENEDGSLHDVFMGDACRASILKPLQSERSGSLTSAQLFENIREAQVKDIVI